MDSFDVPCHLSRTVTHCFRCSSTNGKTSSTKTQSRGLVFFHYAEYVYINADHQTKGPEKKTTEQHSKFFMRQESENFIIFIYVCIILWHIIYSKKYHRLIYINLYRREYFNSRSLVILQLHSFTDVNQIIFFCTLSPAFPYNLLNFFKNTNLEVNSMNGNITLKESLR